MDDEDDDENVRKLGERIHIDYDIARGLVDEVIPYSLEYFLGVKLPEDDNYSDEEDNLDDIDEEEEHSDEEKPKKKDKKKKK